MLNLNTSMNWQCSGQCAVALFPRFTYLIDAGPHHFNKCRVRYPSCLWMKPSYSVCSNTLNRTQWREVQFFIFTEMNKITKIFSIHNASRLLLTIGTCCLLKSLLPFKGNTISASWKHWDGKLKKLNHKKSLTFWPRSDITISSEIQCQSFVFYVHKIQNSVSDRMNITDFLTYVLHFPNKINTFLQCLTHFTHCHWSNRHHLP
jgi:hypothetical protein